MPDEPTNEDDPNMEELTLSQASKEFGIKHGTLGSWVWAGKIPARKEFSELGQVYYLVRRGDVSQFLHNRSRRGPKLNLRR